MAAAVLSGALIVGDCVRGSLREMQAARLGGVQFALPSGDRFFREQLAANLASDGMIAAPVLRMNAVAASADGAARANQARILGVDRRFWSFGAEGLNPFSNAPPDSVAINEALARHLRARPGDEILVRLPKPAFLPAETPLALREDATVAFRWRVAAIVPDSGLGRFSIEAGQTPPFNVFVPLELIQAKLGLPDRANLLLAAKNGASLETANASLKSKFRLADAQVELRPSPDGLEMTGSRVFLDPPLVRAATNAVPSARPISAYFVNEFRAGNRSTPYSIIAAAGPPLVPADLAADEIVINQWLAEDLAAGPGDPLSIAFYVIGKSGQLEERRAGLRIRSIVPLEGPQADRSLMPEFPGIAKAEKTENWDAGFALDMKRIRPKDEQYWKDHRGTPKAFVALKTGESLWGSRFGADTAVRFPAGVSEAAAQAAILGRIDPAQLGLAFLPVRELGVAAVAQAEDFGGLFLGFSFFLMAAAVVLTGLMFRFGLDQRMEEAGTLLALGWTAGRARRLFLAEAALVAALGGAVGALGGAAYAAGILHALNTVWRGAVGTSSLHFHATAGSVLSGGLAAVFIGFGVIWWGLRQAAARPVRELLDQSNAPEMPRSTSRWIAWAGTACALAAVALAAASFARGGPADAGAFFGAGALLLTAGICFAAWALGRMARAGDKLAPLTLAVLAARGCARRRSRSLSVIALLAAGSFLIAAIEAVRPGAGMDPSARASGTGGFALIGEAAFPILQDLNSTAGRDFYGLESLGGARAVAFRVRDGEEASCLNLNRAQAPRLLGADPEALARLGAFSFAQTASKTPQPWLLLKPSEPGVVPAIADADSLEWALGRKIGDTMDFVDEAGHPFKIRFAGALAGSILQGSVIIDEDEFSRRFPGVNGHRFFLFDVPAEGGSNEPARVSALLGRALADSGMELTPAPASLAALNAVENTYLDTFQLLGALGLMLGSAGLGAVALRNALERRAELALLLAAGFTPGRVRWMLLLEHGALLAAGLGLGVVSALAAVLPQLWSPAAHVPWASLGAALALVFAAGFLSVWAAARAALRGKLLPALRGEWRA